MLRRRVSARSTPVTPIVYTLNVEPTALGKAKAKAKSKAKAKDSGVWARRPTHAVAQSAVVHIVQYDPTCLKV